MRWKDVVNAMCRDAKFCVLCEMKYFIYKTMSKKAPYKGEGMKNTK